MSRQYPIWNDVDACIYQSNKSFGAKNASVIRQKVGSSRTNSHDHCTFATIKRYEDGVWIFSTSLNGKILVKTFFKDNNGKPGDFIKKIDHTKKIKGL